MRILARLRDKTWFHRLIVFYALVFVVLIYCYAGPASENQTSLTLTPTIYSSTDRITIKRDLGKGAATLILELKQFTVAPFTTWDLVSVQTGQHRVRVFVHDDTCECPHFWARLQGDALVSVKFSKAGQEWTCTFSIPFQGNYSVDFRWYGCDKPMRVDWISLSIPVELQAYGRQIFPTDRSKESYMFANSFWVSKRRLPFPFQALENLPDYMWWNPYQNTTGQDNIVPVEVETLGIHTMVSKHGTFVAPHGTFKFDENGNYELVCFWGGPSMWKLWHIFLAERRFIFPQQRPFKFHYYNVTSLVHPDRDWPLKEKERVRKCKHIFLSVDDLTESVSQPEFTQQLTSFVGHLIKLLNDDTFPIWILTATEPSMTAKSCHPLGSSRSTEHPCNDILKGMFRQGSEKFPTGQVHLMDNTDVAQPQFDQNYPDVLANVAMRIFVAVGKGVADWRAIPQQGLIDGLHRNGTVEPNPILFPYEQWNQPS